MACKHVRACLSKLGMPRPLGYVLAADVVAFHARARALEEGIDSKAAEIAALARQEADIYDALAR